MVMSTTRQLVSLTTLEARNASADENALAAKPNCRSKSGSDSRTDSSSSTIDTSERLAIMSSPWLVISRQVSGVRGNSQVDHPDECLCAWRRFSANLDRTRRVVAASAICQSDFGIGSAHLRAQAAVHGTLRGPAVAHRYEGVVDTFV
jgi:hypothetical protein